MSSELIERWPGYNEQSWSERFAEIDRLNSQRHAETMALIKQIGDVMQGKNATIAALQAELAEAREVPGKIVDWLREKSDEQHDKGHGREAAVLSDAADAIEARDWSK